MRSESPLTPGRRMREPANDEVDLDAGLRSLVERFDHRGLEQRIHLGDNVRGAAGLRVLLLAADEAQKTLGHGERRHQQRAVVVDLGVRGEVVEDHVHALGNLRIAGEQAQVGVEARGDGVVVAGAEVAVAAGHAVFVAAHQHGQLAVRLQAHHAVKDLHAGVFHAARPADVRRLVEARHQLHHHRGFLGRAGFGQRLEHRRVVAGAVERLLHGHDGRILRALLDELDHRIVGVVGMVEQNVAMAQLVEDAGGLAAQDAAAWA